jgi:predicted Zn-dependent protease
MNRHQVKRIVACLLLAGGSSCAVIEQAMPRSSGLGQFVTEQAEANRRADELQKECEALKARSITFEEESAFGGAVSVNWVSQGGGLTGRADAKALHLQLNTIGKNLAAQSSRPNLPWTFGVLQSPGVNAVSGPGGYVFVSEGLLARLDNEAQLAGVLAHEIAHITGKHALEEYQAYLVEQCQKGIDAERSRVWVKTGTGMVEKEARQLGQGLAQVLPASQLRELFTGMVNQFDFNKAGKEVIQAITNGVVARLVEKGFQKEDEFAADQDAVELMAAAGYAPEEYVSFLSKLPEQGLSTAHPSKGERQKRLREHLGRLRASPLENEFTTPVDLSRTKVVPLRDALQPSRAGSAARAE